MRMKTILCILFSTILLVACSGGGNTEKAEENKEKVPVEETENNEMGEESGIEVDKGLLHVEMTLPASLFEESELEEIESSMENEYNAKASRNDDGSVTVKMSKSEHKEMMAQMEEDISTSMEEISAGEDFPSIKDITYNKDFSSFEVIVDREVFENSMDGFATMSVGLSGLFYQAYDGKDITKEKVVITLADEATGEAFQEIVYPDALEEMGEMK